MPLYGRTRVDKKMHALFEVLKRDQDITIEGHSPSSVKLTFGGRTACLPAKYAGHSSEAEVKRLLHSVGIELAFERLPEPGEKWEGSSVDLSGAAGGPSKDVFGFSMSDNTESILTALISNFRRDIETHTKTAVDAAVNEAVDTLADASNQEDYKRLERALEETKDERNTAVADLVRQRDEAKSRVRELEEEIKRIRHGLELLGIKLPETTDA